ncbi:MAG: DUF2461 domain-containing protein [Verrucomicrobia bacterium]|nr:DUF2461 domain-containing protein [Verrucomicrobiota bacterium]
MPANSDPTHFPPAALQFLRDLARHNEREWFKPRKEQYAREVLEPLRAVLTALTAAFAKARLPLRADPEKSIFRVHRDVRFSADKRPYKTHASAILSPGADKSRRGVVYLHLQPAESFVASAFYQPEKDELQRWRVSFAERPGDFEKVLRQLRKNGLELRMDESMKTMPRDFGEYANSSLAPCFRLRSFLLSRSLTDTEVTQPGLVNLVTDFARRSRPLLDYGWSLTESASA